MQYTKIEIEGAHGTKHRATISRVEAGSKVLRIEITTDAGTKRHHVQADDQDGIESMACLLQTTLDGCVGTNSEIHEYLGVLNLFAL